MKGKKLEKELNNIHKGTAVYYQLDISIEESVDNIIKIILDKFSKIDVFINCSWQRTKDWMMNVEEVPYRSIQENLLCHLGGYFICTQKLSILMKKQNLG